jgi:phospholipase/lecithinase/hemolysin
MIHLHTLTAFAALTIPSILAYPSPPPSSTWTWSNTEYLIAFGDSYTYVQGTHGLQNYSFIGDLQNFSFNASALLSDRIVQNQTATAEGGPNWVEFLTGCGLQPGLTDPQQCNKQPGGKGRQLWDFAFAGSDISEAYTPLHHNFTVSLVNQVKQFVEYANPVLESDVRIDKEKTLVAVWIGINDIGDSDTYNTKYNISFPAFYNEIVGTLFDSVQDVYDLGYRNFLVMELPPLNRTPPNLVRAAGPLPNATMIEWYDQALQNHSKAFEESNEDAKVMVFPTTEFLNYVLDHGAQYGYKNTTGYCASYDQPYINTDPGMYGCLPLEEYL